MASPPMPWPARGVYVRASPFVNPGLKPNSIVPVVSSMSVMGTVTVWPDTIPDSVGYWPKAM